MTYSSLITELRRATRDLKYKAEELFDGDGSTKVFIVKSHPVIEDSQQILVGGSLQTETTHYTFDDDLGEINFITAPASGSDNVKCTYRHANFNDTDWMDMINNSIEVFGEKFWTEVIDFTTLDTVANQAEYSLNGLSNGSSIFKVIDFRYRPISSSSADVAGIGWRAFTIDNMNVVYLKDSNKVRLNPPFGTASYDIYVRALRRPVTSSSTGATVDLEDDELKAIKEHCKGQYYMSLSALKAGDITAVSKDNTISPVGQLTQLAKFHFDLAEKYAKRVKKSYPAQGIPFGAEGYSS